MVEMARRCVIAFGCTDQELAAFLGVAIITIHDWKREHPEFLEAITQSKMQVDGKVVEKLFHRAMGYSHETVKIFMTPDGPVKVPYTEHYPPDTTAMIFWLKNRDPKRWRDKVELTGEDGGPIKIQRVEHTIVQIDSTAEHVEDTDAAGVRAAVEDEEVQGR